MGVVYLCVPRSACTATPTTLAEIWIWNTATMKPLPLHPEIIRLISNTQNPQPLTML